MIYLGTNLIKLKAKNSDSQSLLRRPQVVRKISRSGLQITIQFNILCSADHQITLSGPRTEKVWETLA